MPEKIIRLGFQEVPKIEMNYCVERLSTEFAIFDNRIGIIFEIEDCYLKDFAKGLENLTTKLLK